MSSSLIAPDGTPDTGNRRVSPREKLAGFALVFFGGDNWGTLINISAGGMAFEFTQPPPAGHSSTFVIEVLGFDAASQLRSSVRTEGHLAWTNERNKTAGIQFINLAENAQQQINEWFSVASTPVVEDASDVQQEMLTTIPAHLRELLSIPVETPDQVTSTAYRQYLDASFSRLEKMSPSELLEREARAETETPFEPISEPISDAVPLESLPTPPDTAHDTLAQEPGDSQPRDLQSRPSTIEEILAFELVEPPDSETPFAAETPVVLGAQTALPEPIAEPASLAPVTEATPREPIAQATSLEPIGEAAPIELVTTPFGHNAPDAPAQKADKSQSHDTELDLSTIEEILAFELVESPDSETVLPADAPNEPAAAASLEPIATPAPFELPVQAESLERTEPKNPFVPEPRFEPAAKTASLKPVMALPETTQAIPHTKSQPVKSTRELDPKRRKSPAPHRYISNPSPASARREDFAVAATSATNSRPAGFAVPLALQQPPPQKARFDRVALFCVVGCFALLLVLSLGIVLSQANRMAAAALLENIRQPFISKHTPPQGAPPTGAIESFQVEVVDIHNRRWLLNFESPVTSTKSLVTAPAPAAAGISRSPQPEASANPSSQPGFKTDAPKLTLASSNSSKESSQPSADSSESHAAATSPNDATKRLPETTAKPGPELAKEAVAEPAGQPAQPVSQPANHLTGQPLSQPPSQSIGQPLSQPAAGVPETPPAASPASDSKLVQSAVLISSVSPVYPPDARDRNIVGDVIVDAFIDETGHVAKMKVISGPNSLRQAAMDSLRKRRYQPVRLRGQAVSTHVHITISFRPN